MPRISPSLLHPQSLWNELHPMGSPEPLHSGGIIEQGETSVRPQQTGAPINQHVDPEPRGEAGPTPE
jgi:hypothetical protein